MYKIINVEHNHAEDEGDIINDAFQQRQNNARDIAVNNLGRVNIGASHAINRNDHQEEEPLLARANPAKQFHSRAKLFFAGITFDLVATGIALLWGFIPGSQIILTVSAIVIALAVLLIFRNQLRRDEDLIVVYFI